MSPLDASFLHIEAPDIDVLCDGIEHGVAELVSLTPPGSGGDDDGDGAGAGSKQSTRRRRVVPVHPRAREKV